MKVKVINTGEIVDVNKNILYIESTRTCERTYCPCQVVEVDEGETLDMSSLRHETAKLLHEDTGKRLSTCVDEVNEVLDVLLNNYKLVKL